MSAAELVLLSSGESVGRLDSPGVVALLDRLAVTNTGGTSQHQTAPMRAGLSAQTGPHDSARGVSGATAYTMRPRLESSTDEEGP
jgi:hypothetical protein